MAPVPDDADRAFLATLKILYVEDDNTTRALLRTYLKRRLRVVVEAANGLEGLERDEAELPDLILTDIQMPIMDGLTMAAELRKRGRYVPIIVSTAFEEVGYLRRSIEIGIDRYVTKPVDGASLEAMLLSVARRLRAEQALEHERHRQLEALQTRHLESIGLMAGGMAHDFNNLLQSICGGIGLAQELVAEDTELHELLGGAMEAAMQASALGRQLIALAREPVRLRPEPLGPILAEAVQRVLQGGAVRVELSLPDDLPMVPANQGMLARAFSELARNAGEAMPGGGVLRVTATIAPVLEDEVPTLASGRYVKLAFEDDGPGIDARVLPNIFEPYFSTKERGSTKGMGLGLAVCRALVHKHRGYVTGESPPGGGARMQVFLPIAP